MQGLNLLKQLPEECQKRIIANYGSLEEYYAFVFRLYESDRKWFSLKTEEGQRKRQEIQNKMFDLEDELKLFGIDYGYEILTEISSDHGEIILDGFLK